MNAEVPLSSFLTYWKGKPLRVGNVFLHKQLPVLSPEYLRGNSQPDLDAPIEGGVVLEGSEIILLWDGSNAGEFFRAKRGLLASTMVAFNFDDSEIDRDYLYYELKRFEPELKALTSGSGIPHVDKEILLSHKIRKPVRACQRKIADVLSMVDQAIEQTEALIAKYQRVKTGLMQDLFTRGIDEHGRLRDPSTHRFKQSPLGQIPIEWIHTTMECAVLNAGDLVIGPFGSDLLVRDYRTEGVPVVFVRDVREDGFQWRSNIYIEEKKAQQLAAHAVGDGDVVITKMGMPPCIAAAYPMSMPKGIVTADIIRMRPRANFAAPFWIAAFINSDRCRDQVRQITGGLTRPKVTLSDFRSLQIIIPPYSEQKQIESIFLSFNNLYSTVCDSLVKLQKLKTGLMQDLLTGKVSVEPLLAAD